MSSLIFRTLDAHVVGGLADDAALKDERGTMSYAELLHESASIAGALSHMGIEAGTPIQVDLPSGRDQIIAVLAAARLGAIPRGSADYRLSGTPPTLHTPDTEVPWHLLIRAGRIEPAPAPDRDPDGYEDLMQDAYEDIFETLSGGGIIT